MHEFVSETAIFGDLTRGPRVVDERVRQEMKKILAEVQNGDFANEWILENKAGKVRYNALQRQDLDHQIEQVGKQLRSRMSWLQNDK